MTFKLGNRRRFIAGYSLIETAVASGILALVLGSTIELAARGFRYTKDMRRWSRSTQVLQQKIEDLRLITIQTNLWAMNNSTFTDSSIAGQFFQGSIQMASYNPTYSTDIVANVTITITWTNSVSKLVTNRLTTLICANGLNKYIF